MRTIVPLFSKNYTEVIKFRLGVLYGTIWDIKNLTELQQIVVKQPPNSKEFFGTFPYVQ